ncbi:methionyl-tRNA formyltransferase [Sulfurimonas hongkongensis]|uniref:Methionyl-tRNA formyltransferase n=1 Tax=Sulfurimonas hongkongensis TaxID=1172190 RepID=T0JF19_9BACT|nr:methionyl-tRNA formyltransferase [Sulfurimonas hongkongensis]EQB35442.1 methionyl-tRNA formyltransferase [Sulfurimonas hongkongensis]
MRIIFMGTPFYAKAILDKIIDTPNMEVVAIYTQPDKPVGRKKIMTPPVVKTLAQRHNIEVYQPQRLRDKEVVEKLLSIECDFIVVAAYGQILPCEVLEHAPCINLHASILPAYRGASPIQQTLLNADKKTGVTAMLMDEGLDTGDILKIETISVEDNEMAESLFDRLTEVATVLTIDVLKNFDSLKVIKQDETKATYCKKITKEDGKVEFVDAKEIYNKYRAFTPWPGVYLDSGLKLKNISLEDVTSTNKEGSIISIEKDSIVVGCKQGSIRVFRVQPASKKEMDILSYINGQRLFREDTLS